MSTQHPRDGIRPQGDRPEPAEPAGPAPSAAGVPAVVSAAPAKEKSAQPVAPPARPRWTWQLVFFFWITSVIFLGLYELLWTVFRIFGGADTSP